MTESPSTAPHHEGSLAIVVGAALPTVAFVLAVGGVIASLTAVPVIDSWWNATVAQFRNPVFDAVAFFLDVWGAGAIGFGLVPALLVVPLLARRDFPAILALLAVGVLSLVVVQTVKPLINRARPADMLTVSDVGSFPSGHVTNAATLCVFMALVYRRLVVWLLAAVYIAATAFARTYLHAHWLSDVIAGVVLGAALAVIAFVVMRLVVHSRALRHASAGLSQ